MKVSYYCSRPIPGRPFSLALLALAGPFAAQPASGAFGAAALRSWWRGRRPRTCRSAARATGRRSLGADVLSPVPAGKYLRAHTLGPERW